MARFDRLGNTVLPGIGVFLNHTPTPTLNTTDNSKHTANHTTVYSNVCTVKAICQNLHCSDIHSLERYMMNLCCVSPDNKYLFIATTYKIVCYHIDTAGILCDNSISIQLEEDDNLITNMITGYIDQQPVLCTTTYAGAIHIYRIHALHEQSIKFDLNLHDYNDNSVWSITISPRNVKTSYIAIGNNSHRVFTFYDIFSNNVRCIVNNRAHTNNIPCVSSTSDGKHIISASIDAYVRVSDSRLNRTILQRRVSESWGWSCGSIAACNVHQSYVTYNQYIQLIAPHTITQQQTQDTTTNQSLIHRAIQALQHRTPLDIVNALLSHDQPVEQQTIITTRTQQLLEQSRNAMNELRNHRDNVAESNIETQRIPQLLHNTDRRTIEWTANELAVVQAAVNQAAPAPMETVTDIITSNNNLNEDDLDSDGEFEVIDPTVIEPQPTMDELLQMLNDDEPVTTNTEPVRHPATHVFDHSNNIIGITATHDPEANLFSDAEPHSDTTEPTHQNNTPFQLYQVGSVAKAAPFHDLVLYGTHLDLYLLDSQLNTLCHITNAADITVRYNNPRLQYIRVIPELSIVLVAAITSNRIVIYHIVQHTDQYSMQRIGYIPEQTYNHAIVGIHITELSDGHDTRRLYIAYTDCTVSCYQINKHIDFNGSRPQTKVAELFQLITQSNIL